jgi:hypothetical protein
MEIICCWELSGNGFGQRAQEEDEFGHLTEENFMDDNRSSFLRNYRSHILYLWHLSDQEDILQSVKSILDPACSATTDSTPEITPAVKKRKLEDEERSFRRQVGASFDTISFATLCNQISQTQKQKADVEVRMVLATDDSVIEVYRRMMAEADATISTLKARLRSEEHKKDDSGTTN